MVPEPKEGIIIALRFGEIKARRKFKKAALFQVYAILYIQTNYCGTGTRLIFSNPKEAIGGL